MNIDMQRLRKVNIDNVTELEESEYLLKFFERTQYGTDDKTTIGFMSKLNKSGTMPKAFRSWQGYTYNGNEYKLLDLDTYIFNEYPRSGWKVGTYRTGDSQSWVQMLHPLNFCVEIYMFEFFKLLKTINIIDGELQGKFRWENKKLIGGAENGN